MRYPPAIAYLPARSRVYCVVAMLVTIILIALCAISMPANGHFSFKNSLLMGFATAVCLWLLHDAWRHPRGRLHYAQGQWIWQLGPQEIAGTLHLHLDLQNYLLVSFAAQHGNASFLSKTTQWFHLEARQVDPATWGKLRRAFHAQVEPSHEAVAL